MSYVDYITHECVCRLRNGDSSTFYMTISGQEYKIVFEWFDSDNPNDFRLYKDLSTKHQTLYANLNRFM